MDYFINVLQPKFSWFSTQRGSCEFAHSQKSGSAAAEGETGAVRLIHRRGNALAAAVIVGVGMAAPVLKK